LIEGTGQNDRRSYRAWKVHREDIGRKATQE